MQRNSLDLSTPITQLGSSRPAIAADDYRPQEGRSYVRGPNYPALSRQTVWQLLQQTAFEYGSHDAAVFCETGTRWSWADLLRKADQLAAGLLALGLSKGDRLAIWSPNNEQWLLTQFATARIGVVLVTINPAYRSAELEYVLNKSGARVLVMAQQFRHSDYGAMLAEIAPEIGSGARDSWRAARVSRLRAVVQIGGQPGSGIWGFDELMQLGGPASRRQLDAIGRSLDPDDAINIQFTSGTTGSPKGATLTHYNVVNNARLTVDRLNLNHRDRLGVPVPLYHCFGMVMGVLGAASCGCCMVFPGQAFNPESTLAAIERERCSALYGVPTMFVAMLESEQFGRSRLDSLRTGIMAGAPCPIEIMKQVIGQMYLSEITIAYGMTETSPVSFQSHTDDSVEKRVATVGRVQAHTEIKIVDEQGSVVAVGQQGELCARGYLVMQGYWRDDSRTREAIDAAGWMHSGDLATMDADGYCAITGRVKDMIIRGGENIYPREIEEYLFTHPKIRQVQVFGVPDEKLGEIVCAWVVTTVGESMTQAELQAYCRDRIAHYKVPQQVLFRDEIPMTVTGKPQKFVMRDEVLSIGNGG